MNTEKPVHGLTTAATEYDVSRHIHPVVHLVAHIICSLKYIVTKKLTTQFHTKPTLSPVITV